MSLYCLHKLYSRGLLKNAAALLRNFGSDLQGTGFQTLDVMLPLGGVLIARKKEAVHN